MADIQAGHRNKRQKIAKACDDCKRKKNRCDGQQPCGLCSKRGHMCSYSDTPAKELTAIQHQQKRSNSHSDEYDHASLTASEAPVPRTARFLSDGSGRYNYIGDSASLSFLQSAALVVHSALGECEFTAHVSKSPTQQDSERLGSTAQVREDRLEIDVDRAERLANEYLTATGCLLDLFDANELVLDMRRWAVGHDTLTSTHKSVILLVGAIGSQMDPQSTVAGEATALFERGRQLAYDIMADEPCVVIVQAFSLITMYLMGDGKPNIAFMNLGIALRAAYTLGLHRQDFTSFSTAEQSVRKKAWQSVRVLDIFLSASTGRPPATSDSEKDQVYVPGSTTHRHPSEDLDERFSSATLGLCAIGERILIDVYKKRSVSTVLVQKISHQIRDWLSGIPPMPAALEFQTKSLQHIELARIIASAHLIGAYYWAIILLTRPFLLFHVSMYQSQAQYTSNAIPGSIIPMIAEACIVAAINGIDLLEDVLQHPRLPRRLPVILNSVLNCALTVGVAIFADFDQTFPLSANLERCLAALRQISETDAVATQYLTIVQSLTEAIEQYKVQRGRSALRSKQKHFDGLFGSVDSHFAAPRQFSQFAASTGVGAATTSPMSDFNFEFDLSSAIHDGYATIFPSGLLLSRPGSSHGMRDGSSLDGLMFSPFDNMTGITP